MTYEYDSALKAIKIAAHNLGYSASDIKEVVTAAQETSVDPGDLAGYMRVRLDLLERQVDELSAQVEIIEAEANRG